MGRSSPMTRSATDSRLALRCLCPFSDNRFLLHHTHNGIGRYWASVCCVETKPVLAHHKVEVVGSIGERSLGTNVLEEATRPIRTPRLTACLVQPTDGFQYPVHRIVACAIIYIVAQSPLGKSKNEINS